MHSCKIGTIGGSFHPITLKINGRENTWELNKSFTPSAWKLLGDVNCRLLFQSCSYAKNFRIRNIINIIHDMVIGGKSYACLLKEQIRRIFNTESRKVKVCLVWENFLHFHFLTCFHFAFVFSNISLYVKTRNENKIFFQNRINWKTLKKIGKPLSFSLFDREKKCY